MKVSNNEILVALCALVVVAIAYQLGYLNRFLPAKWQKAEFLGNVGRSDATAATLHGHDAYYNQGMYV